MTAQPDELDARARTLEAERARPMARWGARPAIPLEQRQAVAAAVGRTTRREIEALARLFDRRVSP